jgi:hypothetical protein
MTLPPPERYFRYSPSSARKRTVGYFLSSYGTLSVIGVISLLGSAPRLVAVVGVAALALFVGWGTIRAARVSIIVSGDQVRVSNQFRTRVLHWDEIERIELSRLPGFLGSYVPALAFRQKSGWRVKAQAVSSSRWDQEAMLRDWRRVAPAEVIVDTDIDSQRPRRLLRSR